MSKSRPTRPNGPPCATGSCARRRARRSRRLDDFDGHLRRIRRRPRTAGARAAGARSRSRSRWLTIERDILCPLCKYNLRGPAEPRCPECGYAFTWDELLDPEKQKHPYLFEHHPRRNVVSFVRTLLGGLRPRRFWRTLNPAMPSRPRRLAVYAVLTICLIVTVPLASFARYAVETVRGNLRQKAAVMRYFQDPNHAYTKYIVTAHGSTQAYLAQQHQPPFSIATLRRLVSEYTGNEGPVRVLFAILASPWLAFGALMIFRWSMRRAKVCAGHVARCVVYGFDWGFWLVPLVLLLMTDRRAADVLHLHPQRAVPILASLVFAAYGTYRLGAAYAN